MTLSKRYSGKPPEIAQQFRLVFRPRSGLPGTMSLSAARNWAIVGDFFALDTKRVLNDLGSAGGIVRADSTFEKIGYCAHTPRGKPAQN
jgi:hypothetical protein